MLRRLAPLALLLASSCPSCQPAPDPECPASVGASVALCPIAKAELIVEATVVDFATTPRVLDVEGFPETTFTPAAIQIDSTLRGTASGRLDVLVPGCITADGDSLLLGPLQSNGVKSKGFFFIVAADGYAVVKPQGFLRRDGDVLRNTGIAKDGMSEPALKAAIADKADCPATPDAGQ